MPNIRSAGQNEIIANRRQFVARFRLRGLSQREVCQALEQSGQLNPRSGKAWSLFVINTDCQALDAEWRAFALRETIEHKAALLAEIREARRKAWSDGELGLVYQGITQERSLLGLDSPAKHEVTGKDGGAIPVSVSVLSNEELQTLKRELSDAPDA